jgi:hypothetical protein
VKLLDDIAYAGEETYLDFQTLSERLDSSTGLLHEPHPELNDLYSAYYDFFEVAVASIRAFDDYLAACWRALVLDPTHRMRLLEVDPETALKKFYEQHEQLRASIAKTSQCWKITGYQLRYQLRADLPIPLGARWLMRAEAFVVPWLPNSQRHKLRRDLPKIVENARMHLDRFRHLYEFLEGIVKEIESERLGALDRDKVTQHTLSQTLLADRVIGHFIVLFMHYSAGINIRYGQTVRSS